MSSSVAARSVNQFLTRARSLALSPAERAGRPLVGVLGNEGGDMDSVVSALFAAMALDCGLLAFNAPMLQAAGTASASPIFVPLLNFPIADLPLRGDVLGLLKEEAVDHALFLSVADPSPNDVDLLAECDALVIVDHNKLRASQLGLQSKVAAIIDHHLDEGLSLDASPRLVRHCGSAASLVAELCGGGAACAGALPEASRLLLAPIVIDTMNFDPKMNKTTPTDEAAAGGLLLGSTTADAATLAAACGALHDRLYAKKFDVSSLTMDQNLRRDFKAFAIPTADGATVELGIAAWLEPAEDVAARHGTDAFVAACDFFARETREPGFPLDALIVMFAFGHGPTFRRQVLWIPTAADPERSARATMLLDGFMALEANRATDGTGLGFDLDSPELRALFASDPRVQVVKQHGATVSRKGLVPLLLAYAETETATTAQ